MIIERTLNLNKFKHSLFLFGPRQVGKTFLIKNTISSDIFIDLLNYSEFMRYIKDPSILYDEINNLKKDKIQIVIDEIQRCPKLLDVVQLVMENKPDVKFIMTGSSARKLKRAGVNLLGGRAITQHLHPFIYEEAKDYFILEDVLKYGSIPSVFLEKDKPEKVRLLKSYVEIYLKEEIQQESLTRNIPAFALFLELAAHENGNILNFQNIAREAGVNSKTIKEYFCILEDTLLGFFIHPYSRSHRTRIVSHPKFYFFDLGAVNALRGELLKDLTPGTTAYGMLFEHFILLELERIIDYREREIKISFFRTSDGAEVDFILEFADEIWAVEVKAKTKPHMSDLRGLRNFVKDHKCVRALCVCQTPRSYKVGGIEFLPWKDFINQI